MSGNNDLKKITEEKDTPKDAQIAKIESDLEKEKDSRREERFFWIFGIVVIIDAFTLSASSNLAGIFIIAIFQFILLVTLAAWFGLDRISVYLSKILEFFLRR